MEIYILQRSNIMEIMLICLQSFVQNLKDIGLCLCNINTEAI